MLERSRSKVCLSQNLDEQKVAGRQGRGAGESVGCRGSSLGEAKAGGAVGWGEGSQMRCGLGVRARKARMRTRHLFQVLMEASAR